MTPAENRFYRTAGDQAEIPQRIICPGVGCGEYAWLLPGGKVYCTRTESMVDGEQQDGPHVIRAQALRDFADHLRGMARRGVNERITESLLAIADIAERKARGEWAAVEPQPGVDR